jgi:hypothetical protein
MVTDRLMEETDESMLGLSLDADVHHKGTSVDFFKQNGSITKVYEDKQGPICFARVTKSLRLDIHFLNNGDERRNASVLFQGIKPLVENARANGFAEIVFTTNVEKLKDFCVKVFKFEVVPDTYVLRLLL